MPHPKNHAAATSACAVAMGFHQVYAVSNYQEGDVGRPLAFPVQGLHVAGPSQRYRGRRELRTDARRPIPGWALSELR